jgi:type VI secretion system protein ImpA
VPLRDDLLEPVAGDNPSGPSLRYDRVYDQIKEARTEEDDSLPAGEWQRAAKKADFNLVIKLASDALAARSKDLQLLAWLTEAQIKREGITLLPPCLSLFLQMQEQFWETLHPEIEDGDSGLRAMPIEWMANRVSALLYSAPLARAGYGFYQYKESRSVGYEADVTESDAKREAREAAVAEGKVTAEAFDAALAATPKSFYVETESALSEATDLLQRLAAFCDERYGADGPSLSRLEQAIQEVKHVVAGLLQEKRKTEPDVKVEQQVDIALETSDATSASESIAQPEPQQVVSEPATRNTPEVAAAGRPMRPAAEPANAEEAAVRVQACARFLAQQDEASPVAYLLQTGLRWGELRARQGAMDAGYPPPPTDVRQQLRRTLNEGNWSELLRASVAAAGEPWGGMWLDLQRYIWKASVELGYGAILSSVLSSLGALLRDFPALPELSFNDDTPVANPETLRWLEESVLPKPVEPAPPALELVYREERAQETGSEIPRGDQHGGMQEMPAPDTLEIARGLIQQGRAQQAIQLLVRDAAQQESGRLRFQRRTQVAQLCLAAGYESVAAPMLEQLAGEIEQRKLEGWESSDLLAPPLTLLLKCMQGKGEEEERRQEIFDRLCRIDPTAAMECSS